MEEKQFQQLSKLIEHGFSEIHRRLESVERLQDLERRVAELEERGRQCDAAMERAILRMESGLARSRPPAAIGGMTFERVITDLKLDRDERDA